MTSRLIGLSVGLLAGLTSTAVQAATVDEDTCANLVGQAIAKEAISLDTNGAEINAANWISSESGGYCEVSGATAPVDPEAPSINWQVNLPKAWNGRMLHYGGGGYNGVLPDLAGNYVHGPLDAPVPLVQGYVTLGSDSGHAAQNSNDASFAVNDEALANYGYMHIKKTLDVAKAVVNLAYAEEPRAVYFAGGSTGGREGLTAALRWPTDYDGIISYYPTANFVGLRFWGSALNRAIYDEESAGWIAPDLVKAIAAYATEQCDALDGVEDGLVSNVQACRAQSAAVLEHFACMEGQSEGQCLTPIQIERTIKVYHEGYTLPYELANGFTTYPGYNSLEGIVMNLGTEKAYAEPVISGPNAHHAARAYEFFQYMINQDGNFDFRTFDITDPGAYRDRIMEISEMIDANNPDLSAFADAGGKLILVQGTEDPSVTPNGTIAYFENVMATMGEEAVRNFAVLYMLPGLAHGGGNFAPAWDSLAALDRWVADGVRPAGYVATDTTTTDTRGRTLPVCAHPSWPRYLGEGDVRDAANYQCATE